MIFDIRHMRVRFGTACVPADGTRSASCASEHRPAIPTSGGAYLGAGGWRESLLLLIVAGLAVFATNPALLATFKVTNQWAVGFISRLSQDSHTKHQRLSASLQECSDDRLEHVAEAILDSEPLPTWERNQLQGVLWSGRPGPWPGATVRTGGAGRRWSAGWFTVPGVCASPAAHSWSTRERSVTFG